MDGPYKPRSETSKSKVTMQVFKLTIFDVEVLLRYCAFTKVSSRGARSIGELLYSAVALRVSRYTRTMRCMKWTVVPRRELRTHSTVSCKLSMQISPFTKHLSHNHIRFESTAG